MSVTEDTIDITILRQILENLVTEPEAIEIDREVDEQGVLVSVLVSSKDMGIVIGRNGSMATAMKILMRAIGKSHNMSLRLQFREPDGSVKYSGKKGTGRPEEEVIATTSPSQVVSNSVDSNTIEDDLSEFVIN